MISSYNYANLNIYDPANANTISGEITEFAIQYSSIPVTSYIDRIYIKHKVIKFKEPIPVTIFFDDEIGMYWAENKEYAIHGYGQTEKEALKDCYYGLKFQWEIMDMSDSELTSETKELKKKFQQLLND